MSTHTHPPKINFHLASLIPTHPQKMSTRSHSPKYISPCIPSHPPIENVHPPSLTKNAPSHPRSPTPTHVKWPPSPTHPKYTSNHPHLPIKTVHPNKIYVHIPPSTQNITPSTLPNLYKISTWPKYTSTQPHLL